VEPERCAECGFDGSRLTVADSITALRSLGPRWRRLFSDVPPERLRERPSPDIWSALEYAGHTRDVLLLHGLGLEEVLRDTRPEFPSIEPDGLDASGAAADHGYNALDPARVLDELSGNAERLATLAGGQIPEHWGRVAVIGGREVDAGYLLRHAVHDATHHLKDVEKVLEGLGR
jgi:hypothetical protein